VQSVKSELASVKDEVQNVKSQMNSRFDTMEAKFSILETKIENMATKEDVADIPNLKMAISESLDMMKRIQSTQEMQERTLDFLSRRSIDQEAELPMIK